jgi:hypothetical protein
MSSGSRKKRQSVSQTVGGVLFGFEQQVLKTVPPAEELVHHARPDAPIPSGDGSFLTLELPEELDGDDPWAGIEEELTDDDPWAEFAAEAAGAADPAPADGGPREDGGRGEGEPPQQR